MQLLNDAFATRPRAAWVEKIREAGVPAGPVRDLNEALGSPEVAAAGLVRETMHPTAGNVKLPASPVRLIGEPGPPHSPPPLHGQHTDEVLEAILDLSPQRLAQLRADGIIR